MKFLTESQVMLPHTQQIERFGGADGLASPDLLRSAIGMPESSFGGQLLHETIYEQAAADLFHLVPNHPFVDGNKRIGAIAAFTFLRVNGYDLTASNEEFEALVMETANGRAEKPQIAVFLETNSRVIADATDNE